MNCLLKGMRRRRTIMVSPSPSARSQPCGALGGCSSSLDIERRFFRGRESSRSGNGGSCGRGSVVGSSWTFACCLRFRRSPIRPAITSNVPANMSQCGNSHSMPVTPSTYFFTFSPNSTRRRIASERLTSWSLAQASISAVRSVGKRTALKGSDWSDGPMASGVRPRTMIGWFILRPLTQGLSTGREAI
jgi:hypothetical protein